MGYVFTLYQIDFAQTQKPYRIGILFTHKNNDFGAISVTEQTAPRPSLKWTMNKLLSGFSMVLIYRGRNIFFLKYLGQTHGRGVKRQSKIFCTDVMSFFCRIC